MTAESVWYDVAMDFFPIEAAPTGPPAWIAFVGFFVLLLNMGLWFVAALILAAGAHVGWLLV